MRYIEGTMVAYRRWSQYPDYYCIVIKIGPFCEPVYMECSMNVRIDEMVRCVEKTLYGVFGWWVVKDPAKHDWKTEGF